MYALLKNTAESFGALKNNNFFDSALARFQSGGHACGTSAYNSKIIFNHIEYSSFHVVKDGRRSLRSAKENLGFSAALCDFVKLLTELPRKYLNDL